MSSSKLKSSRSSLESERRPAKAKVVGSNPTGKSINLKHFLPNQSSVWGNFILSYDKISTEVSNVIQTYVYAPVWGGLRPADLIIEAQVSDDTFN